MWSQVCSQSTGGFTSHSAVTSKNAALQILPCTVSQLLSASQVDKGAFAIGDLELNQVSVVGVVRECSPLATSVRYSVDDMTGPPLNVKQWVNTEDGAIVAVASPGSYVKVTGNPRNIRGQRYLMAMNIRCIEDLNEITSHMLEVVQAHMQLSGKVLDLVYDVNMNTVASWSGSSGSGHPKGVLKNGLSSIQGQVSGLKETYFCNLSLCLYRSSLAFLLNEGHAFLTIDEHHFKSTDPY
uniref:Replication protein A 32 kDa subunit-like n=1 Tax=Scophthalmus maximus TaxID=52904 RepID=A0A8D3BET0_SCOMX